MDHAPSDHDEARLLPHLRSGSELLERARMLHSQRAVLRREYALALDEGRDTTLPQPRAQGGDPRQLRGIPVIARAVGGTSPGTQPEQETVRRLMRQAA